MEHTAVRSHIIIPAQVAVESSMASPGSHTNLIRVTFVQEDPGVSRFQENLKRKRGRGWGGGVYNPDILLQKGHYVSELTGVLTHCLCRPSRLVQKQTHQV